MNPTKLIQTVKVLLIAVSREDIKVYPKSDKTPNYIQMLENSMLELEAEIEKQNNKIEFTRVNSDSNGNPRYVCSWLAFQKKDENINYEIALKRAKKLGGGKFNNKQYGGGVVFQSYNIIDTERKIKELLKSI